MRLNDESRYWLEQEAATGNETARRAIEDILAVELHVSLLEQRKNELMLEIGRYKFMRCAIICWLLAYLAIRIFADFML